MRTVVAIFALCCSAMGQVVFSGSVSVSGGVGLKSQGVAALVVTTLSVPNATQNAAYTPQQLTASGGVPCGGNTYAWTLFSGSLPTGFSLSGGGVISGTDSGTGTFNFVVQAADCGSHTANSVTLTIVVNSSGGGCVGTAPYTCSRTDTNTADILTLPSWGPNTCVLASATSCGNLTGANTTITDPAFGNTITRLTDNSFGNGSMQVTSGSGDLNHWNTNSTFLSTTALSGFDYLWSWNTSTKSGARLYTASISQGLHYAGNTEFSRSTSTTVYLFPSISVTNKTLLGKYDLSNCTPPSCGSATPPTVTSVFDFTSSANCLGGGFSATWTDDGGVSASDSAFAVGFSNSGGQGGAGAKFVTVYAPAKGCILLNTATGAITADAGFSGGTGLTCTSSCTGQVANWATTFGASGFSLHNIKLGRGGDWLVIVPCSSGCGIPCSGSACNNPVFWNVGTNVVNVPANSLSGHFTEGYTTWTNNPSSMRYVGRQFTSPTSTTGYTTSISTIIDAHQGWNNVDASDTLPFIMTTFFLNHSTGFVDPYVNEVVGVKPTTANTRWRFAHTYNTNTSTDPNFGIEEAIGSVSQDGNWYMWGSNGMGQFGAENGSAGCTLGGTANGTNCRGEILIVPLR